MVDKLRTPEEIAAIRRALEELKPGLVDDQLSLTRPKCLTPAELAERDLDMVLVGLSLASRLRSDVNLGDGFEKVDLEYILGEESMATTQTSSENKKDDGDWRGGVS